MNMSQMFSYAKELGFEAIEFVNHDFNRHNVPAIKEMLEYSGLKVSCINGHFGLASCDNMEFRNGIDKVKKMADDAVSLGAHCIMVVPALRSNISGIEDKFRAANRIIEALKEVVSYGNEIGITITVEDFPDINYPLSTIKEMEYILTSVPGLKLTLDSGNFLPAGEDIINAYNHLWSYVENVHIKDWELSPDNQGTICADGKWIRGGLHGKGLIDQEEVLKSLKRKAYSGYMAFEYNGILDNAEATKEGITYIKGILSRL